MDNTSFETKFNEKDLLQQMKQIECDKGNPSSYYLEKYPPSMELQVVLQKDITTFLHRSLPLCMVLAFEKYKPWFYSNFIQIFSFTNDKGNVELNFLEPRDCCSEIVDMICLGFPMLTHVDNILDYIIKNINMGYYLIINVDENYLPNKLSYNRGHFIHPSLIYGYDNEKKQLKAIGFNQNIFQEITFDYAQFNEAYENGKLYYQYSAPWTEWSAIQLLRPKKFEKEYPFNHERFIKELKNYTLSIGDSIRLYSFEYYEDQVEYGLNVYDVFIQSMEDLLQGKITSDYRAIHLLCEHKKCIYDRIEYVISRYNLEGEIVAQHEEYKKVVNQSDIIRIKVLKNLRAFGNTSIYYPTVSDLNLKQKAKVEDVINNMKELKNMEGDILKKIVYQLELFFNSK